CDLLELLADLLDAEHDRPATDGQPAATHGAVALRSRCGVAELDGDLIEVGAEVVGDHLREDGLLALTLRADAAVDRHGAARLDPQGGALPGAEAADLDVGREADTEVAALLASRRLLLAELLVPRKFQRLVQRLRVVAAVVDLAH